MNLTQTRLRAWTFVALSWAGMGLQATTRQECLDQCRSEYLSAVRDCRDLYPGDANSANQCVMVAILNHTRCVDRCPED
ncbi:hypothetical protein [Mesoterricola silvestris]|uniref:Uncharacterized protein n=1 Tax=Mesoterricola silvestris TaxID=2927979 RepID=A0AA48GRS0_9BACT|nr:hypothetical protein [Mesoterricola silvestris]BDU72812.1 hypothetical protein METEAL_19860 [Mesoterricola silvestris]